MSNNAPSTKAKQRDHVLMMVRAVEQALSDNAFIVDRLRDIHSLLIQLHNQLHNRPAARGRRSAPPTRRIKAQVLALKRSHPGLSNQEIAHRFNTNHGRISEILRGKRT